MSETDVTDVDAIRALTADIVSSHVANSDTPVAQIPQLIHEVYYALANAGQREPEAPAPVPAVPVKKSVFSDYIVCLEDGKKLKMLKRHLMSAYNMSADAYRAKWNLPPDYPMVAPAYAEKRSQLAREIGLGRVIAASAAESKVTKVPQVRRGRKKADD